MDTLLAQHAARIRTLVAAIRKHRDQRGDDRCWLDDAELYAVLGEPYETPKLAEPCEMMANCVRFIKSRHNPEVPYVSPEREIEQLRAKLAEWERHRVFLSVHNMEPPEPL